MTSLYLSQLNKAIIQTNLYQYDLEVKNTRNTNVHRDTKPYRELQIDLTAKTFSPVSGIIIQN